MRVGGAGEFFNRRGRAGADAEGAAVEQRCDGSPASGGGVDTPYNGNLVAAQRAAAGGNRYTVQQWRRWMSRADVGWDPKICSTAPPGTPHPLLHQISPWGGFVKKLDHACMREVLWKFIYP
jgi:hypothetical protein